MEIKKILYSVGALAAVVAPITALVACNPPEKENKEVTKAAKKYHDSFYKIKESSKTLIDIIDIQKNAKEDSVLKLSDIGIEQLSLGTDLLKDEIIITNKTDKTMTIKSILTYRYYRDGKSVPKYYNSKQITVSLKTPTDKEALKFVEEKVIVHTLTKNSSSEAEGFAKKTEVSQEELGINITPNFGITISKLEVVEANSEGENKGTVKVKVSFHKETKSDAKITKSDTNTDEQLTTNVKEIFVYGFKESDFYKNKESVEKVAKLVQEKVNSSKEALSVLKERQTDEFQSEDSYGLENLPESKDLDQVSISYRFHDIHTGVISIKLEKGDGEYQSFSHIVKLENINYKTEAQEKLDIANLEKAIKILEASAKLGTKHLFKDFDDSDNLKEIQSEDLNIDYGLTLSKEIKDVNLSIKKVEKSESAETKDQQVTLTFTIEANNLSQDITITLTKFAIINAKKVDDTIKILEASAKLGSTKNLKDLSNTIQNPQTSIEALTRDYGMKFDEKTEITTIFIKHLNTIDKTFSIDFLVQSDNVKKEITVKLTKFDIENTKLIEEAVKKLQASAALGTWKTFDGIIATEEQYPSTQTTFKDLKIDYGLTLEEIENVILYIKKVEKSGSVEDKNPKITLTLYVKSLASEDLEPQYVNQQEINIELTSFDTISAKKVEEAKVILKASESLGTTKSLEELKSEVAKNITSKQTSIDALKRDYGITFANAIEKDLMLYIKSVTLHEGNKTFSIELSVQFNTIIDNITIKLQLK